MPSAHRLLTPPILLAWGLVLCDLADPRRAHAEPAASVLVLPLDARGGAEPELADAMTFSLSAEVQRMGGRRVVAVAELAGLANQERMRQLVDCNSASCAAELAGALNTDEVLFGTLTAVGGTRLVSISRVDARRAEVLGRSQRSYERITASEVAPLMAAMARELYGAQAPAPAAAAQPAQGGGGGPSPVRWAVRGLGVAGAALSAPVALMGLGLLAANGAVVAVDLSRQGGPGNRKVPAAWALGANAALVGSVLAGVVGVTLLLAGAGTLGVSWFL
jgi:hypothetical protein